MLGVSILPLFFGLDFGTTPSVVFFVFHFLLFPFAGEIKSLPWYMKIQWIFMNICGHAALQVTVGYWIMLANCK